MEGSMVLNVYIYVFPLPYLIFANSHPLVSSANQTRLG